MSLYKELHKVTLKLKEIENQTKDCTYCEGSGKIPYSKEQKEGLREEMQNRIKEINEDIKNLKYKPVTMGWQRAYTDHCERLINMYGEPCICTEMGLVQDLKAKKNKIHKAISAYNLNYIEDDLNKILTGDSLVTNDEQIYNNAIAYLEVWGNYRVYDYNKKNDFPLVKKEFPNTVKEMNEYVVFGKKQAIVMDHRLQDYSNDFIKL